MWILFGVVGAILSTLIIVTLVYAKQIKCSDHLIVYCFSVQLVEYIITLVFTHKVKSIITGKKPHKPTRKASSQTDTYDQKLLDTSEGGGILEDTYITLKIKQLNLIVGSFTCSVLFSLFDLFVSYVPNDTITCSDQGISVLQANNWFGVLLLSLKDISQLVPHVCMPVILYVLPIFQPNQSKIEEGDVINLGQAATEEEQEDEPSSPTLPSSNNSSPKSKPRSAESEELDSQKLIRNRLQALGRQRSNPSISDPAPAD